MGRSKDLATGETRFVNTSGDTMTGSLTGTSAGFTGDVNIGNNDASNPVSKLRLGATLYGAADIVPVSTGHKIGLDFKTDSTGDTTIDPVTRMSISNEGYVTKPYHPGFSTRGTAYTQVNAAFTIVKPATTELNVGSHYNSSTGVWTVPVAGNYLVTANGLIYPSGTGGSGSVHNTAWYKNGTQWEDIQNGEYYSNHTNITNTAIIPCAVNDTLDFRFYRSSGSAAAYTGQFIMYGYLLG